MRCNNCGWENPNSNTQCEKCHAPLSSIDSSVQFNSHATVNEAVIFGNQVKQEYSDNVCPKCNYPLRPGTSECPNCGYSVAPRRSSSFSGTINPYVDVPAKSKCILTPIAFATEKSSPDSVEFTNPKNELNRDNLDPGNNTITSKVQAELINENDEWLLSDKSSQQTTFVHVVGRVKLNDGDTILMGNRMFKVRIE